MEIRIGIEKLNFFLVHLVGSIQTKLKLDNKLKTRKQKIVGWALSIMVCVCVECSKQNPKLGNRHKTRNQKIVGRALSIVVCVWNVRNRPKTRNRKIVRDKIHLLQKVGKKLYTGDKINLLQKVEKSEIKKLRAYKNNSKDQVGD